MLLFCMFVKCRGQTVQYQVSGVSGVPAAPSDSVSSAAAASEAALCCAEAGSAVLPQAAMEIVIAETSASPVKDLSNLLTS